VQAVGDVVVDGERVEERALLEDHPDLLAHAHHLGLRVLGDVFAVHEDAPRVGLEQAQYEVDDGGLAAARAAEDDLRLAAVDEEADAVEDDAVVEGEDYVAELDGRDGALVVVHLGEGGLGRRLAHPAVVGAVNFLVRDFEIRGRHTSSEPPASLSTGQS
jgi:hypothetical protein